MRNSAWFSLATIAVALRTMVALWGYSGYSHSPMFGDFEAQRHWMEITVALPIGDWYRQTGDNDLQYWGLDYPPLTAYVSYGFGQLARIFVPNLVELYQSRGHESVNGKTFMRSSVIICDILVLIPLIISLCAFLQRSIQTVYTKSPLTNALATLSCLLLPGVLLIDHGHFQYNGVCLGLALAGGYCILTDRDIAGSVLFCLSLNFKQMSLYYAPVFFFALLRKCFEKGTMLATIVSVAKLGATVVTVFAVLWFPFCAFRAPEDTCGGALLQVLHRQFPFARGIFEDKVANLWYTLSVAVDVRALMTTPQLVASSLALTLALLSPVCYDLLRSPLSPQKLLLALINSSLAFFLASYQVHEKSVLLALLPAGLLVQSSPLFVAWLQLLGCFSMFPLLRRDGLAAPYCACCAIYVCVVRLMVEEAAGDSAIPSAVSMQGRLKTLFVAVSCLGMAVLHILEASVAPPARYPDLYPALFSIFGAANLTAAYVYCVVWQYRAVADTVLTERDRIEKSKKVM